MNLDCRAPLTPAQWQWLRTTSAKFRRVSFHLGDEGTRQLLADESILVGPCPLQLSLRARVTDHEATIQTRFKAVVGWAIGVLPPAANERSALSFMFSGIGLYRQQLVPMPRMRLRRHHA